ncbi:hypothetical protein [Aureimonas ureilytica]|uniref:hypothetical protein n=1 Tax=Aureimonas ureilytica TaxID=401562 RepID=UPI00035F5004|nr:hypothetical protein [Aureimonas ureilytica]
MSPEWAKPVQGKEAVRAGTARHLAIVAAATLLSGAAAAFAVSLVPSVHRARIELSAEGGPLPTWNAAEVHAIADREPTPSQAEGPTEEADTGQEPPRAIDRLMAHQRGHLEGTATRRSGFEALSPTRGILWAEAASPVLATARVQFIADQLLSRRPKPARQLDVAPPVEAPPARPDSAAPLAEARARLDEAERGLAAFDAPAPTDVAAPSPAAGLDPAEKATLESRRSELDAAIAAVEGDDERLTMPGLLGAWDTWRSLMSERRGLQPRAVELTANLSATHPRVRIVRLRLEQLDSEIAQRRERLLGQLQAERAANEAAIQMASRPASRQTPEPVAAEEGGPTRADLQAEVAAARTELDRLQTEANRPAVSVAPPPALASAATPTIRQTMLPSTARSLSIWPAALAGSVAGFLGSAFFVALSVPLRRQKTTTPVAEPTAALPDPLVLAAVPGASEVAMVDDVIEALKFSAVARVVTVSAPGAQTRPLGVDIGRRLALRGRSVLVVDLSNTQDAARAMGLPAGTPGLFDLVRGDANFAEIARRDFATGAEIVASGRQVEGEDRASLWSERRHALDFMERSYETLVIDCGESKAPFLKTIMDPDAALLVWTEGCSAEETEAALDRLRSEGIADMIVVRDRPSN